MSEGSEGQLPPEGEGVGETGEGTGEREVGEGEAAGMGEGVGERDGKGEGDGEGTGIGLALGLGEVVGDGEGEGLPPVDGLILTSAQFQYSSYMTAMIAWHNHDHKAKNRKGVMRSREESCRKGFDVESNLRALSPENDMI